MAAENEIKITFVFLLCYLIIYFCEAIIDFRIWG